MTLLEVTGVTKRFGQTTVLDRVDLAVAEHEVVALIGSSGSGKSTLLRCINLIEPVNEGRVRLDGEEVTHLTGSALNALRCRIGIVYQAFNLFPHLRVLRNVTLGPVEGLGLARAEAEARAEELLTRIGLWDKRDAFPDELSGGQQQRVAIARALAMRPRVLLLDEITSALDPELVFEVLEMIRELSADGMTMVIATHEMAFARDVADRVCFLDGGRILESGPPAAMFSEPKEERTRAFLRRVIASGRL